MLAGALKTWLMQDGNVLEGAPVFNVRPDVVATSRRNPGNRNAATGATG